MASWFTGPRPKGMIRDHEMLKLYAFTPNAAIRAMSSLYKYCN